MRLRDLHDDCLWTLRRHGHELTADERTTLDSVAGAAALGAVDTVAARTARAIVWSFHSQGPGRPVREGE